MTSSKIEKGEMLNAEGKKEADGLPGREETKGLTIPPLALAAELLLCAAGGRRTALFYPQQELLLGQREAGRCDREALYRARWPALGNLGTGWFVQPEISYVSPFDREDGNNSGESCGLSYAGGQVELAQILFSVLKICQCRICW